MAEAEEDRETQQKQKMGELTGHFAETAKPFFVMLEYIRQMKKMTPGEKIALVASAPSEIQTRLSKIIQSHESTDEMETQILKVIESLRTQQSHLLAKAQEDSNSKRDKRVT